MSKVAKKKTKKVAPKAKSAKKKAAPKKKSPPKRTAAKRPAKRPAAKKKAQAKNKPAAKKKAHAKKKPTAARKAAHPKKVSARKVVARAVAKKAVAKKPAAKKAAAKKPAQRTRSSMMREVEHEAAAAAQRGRPDDARAFLPDPLERKGRTKRMKDDLAEELGEDFVGAATSGESVDDARDAMVPEEEGGPFVTRSAESQYGTGTDGSNPEDAEREPFPTSSNSQVV